MQNIRPLRGRVIGEIIDRGEQLTAGGIIMLDDDGKEEGIRPRWFRVHSLHDESKEGYAVGDYILVEHGRWSREFGNVGNEMGLCAIEEKSVMMMSNESPF